MVRHSNILEARERIASVIHRTSILPSRTFSEMSGNKIFLKPENLQRTGSFKLRGAHNRIATLTQEEKAKGVLQRVVAVQSSSENFRCLTTGATMEWELTFLA